MDAQSNTTGVYPFWPPLYPQPGAMIVTHTQAGLLADLPINQAPSGRNDEIPIVQRVQPRQARPTGPGSTTLDSRGQYGTDLYQAFMAPYLAKKESDE